MTESSVAPQTDKINHLDPEGDFNPAIEICFNPYWTGKPTAKGHATGEYKWQRKTTTPHQVMNAVAKGKAFTAALGDAIHTSKSGLSSGIHRDASNFVSMQLAGVDFDAGTSFADILDYPLARNSGSFLYPTASHTPEAPRSRIVFCLEQPIADPDLAGELGRALIHHFSGEMPDKGVHDCVRVWYGTRPGNEPYWIGEMLAMNQVDALIAEYRAAAGVRKPGINRDSSGAEPVVNADPVAVAKARGFLERLKPERADDYNDWIHTGMALKCGIGDAGLDIWEEWSSQSGTFEDGACAAKWETFTPGGGITMGTLMLMAEEDTPTPAPEDTDYFPTETPEGDDAPLAIATPTPAGKVKAKGEKTKGAKPQRAGEATLAQNELERLGYTFRLNEVSEQLEVNGKPIHDGEYADIISQLYDLGIKSEAMVGNVIKAVAWRNRYHPMRDYLNGLKWDGVSRLLNFGRHLRAEEREDKITYASGAALPAPAMWLYRWMIGAVARVLDDALRRPDVPMLVLSGGQRIGKSTFAQWLASPLLPYFREGSIDPDSVEHLRALCETWIWEVGELGNTTRRADVEALKHFLTRDSATYRIPWAKHPVRKQALACFIGTINPDGAGFLSDMTGNRRFLVANLKSIDWNYRNLPIDQLWAEAVNIWRNTPDAWELTPEEVAHRDKGNKAHMQSDWVTDAIEQLFTLTPGDAEAPGMTVYKIVRVLQEHGGRGYAVKALQMQVAAALGALGVVKLQNKRPTEYAGIVTKKGVYVPEDGTDAS